MLTLLLELLYVKVQLGAALEHRTLLGHKARELVSIALEASTTHLRASGIRSHIRAALDRGATEQGIAKMLQLTTSVGTQSVTFGAPILMDGAAKSYIPNPSNLHEVKQ